MTTPQQQASWPPPVGTRITITATCCGWILAETRITWLGEGRTFTAPNCAVNGQHVPNVSYTWSES